MCLLVMSDFVIRMKREFMKKYVGAVLYLLESSTKNILNGHFTQKVPESGRRKQRNIRNCS